LLQDGVATYQELANKFESIFSQKESELDSEAKQVMGEESFKSVLQVLKKKVEESEEKYLRDVSEYVQVLKPLGLKGAKLFKPLRLILTGSVHGPELKQLLPLLPRQTALWHVERWEHRVK